MIPERTAEQMKKFWTKYEHYTVEQWLVQAIHEKTDFSFSHRAIPSSTFEPEFRRKYEIEFMRIENMEPMTSERPVNPLSVQSSYSQNLAISKSMASSSSKNVDEVMKGEI